MRIRRSAIGLFLCAILGANIQFTNANAATFASGTPCEVIVSDISNLTYSHNSGTRECTYTFSYNATVRTITLPTNLVSATMVLTGARGGQGGERYNASATAVPKVTTYSSTNTWVGKYSGTIPSASSKQIEINTGNIGSDGQNFTCNGISHPGAPGGTSSYVLGVGGQGGSQGCATQSNGEAGGTGGGGGGATVAVINSLKIFAGGGGGTGGTGRNANDNANLAGAGASSTNSSNYVSGTNAGESGGNVLEMTNNGCTSNIGGGGGGGGGLIGGFGGIIGYHKCSTHDATAAGGGYPGLNSTSSLLTNTSTSYILKSTDTTDSTAYGSVVIVLIYKGTTTATLSLPTGNLVYRQATIISDTSTVAGKITFRVNGKILTGCKNKVASANVVVTCSYKPSTHNAVIVTATLDPTSAEFIGTVSSSAQFLVANRTGPRVR
jgi:hypothetical protein